MANLSIPPAISSLDSIIWPEVDVVQASNGIKIYQVHKPKTEIVLIEIVFGAGRLQESKHLSSSCTAALLTEGTALKSSQEIAEIFDYHGASIRVKSDFDSLSIKMVCMAKYFNALKEVLQEILLHPAIPQEELTLLKKRRSERLKTDLRKNDLISYRKLTEALYGYQHPYGYNSDQSKYDALEREDLVTHYKDLFTAQNCAVFVAGDISTGTAKAIQSMINSIPSGNIIEPHIYKKRPSSLKKITCGGNPLQTSIRMGRTCFKRNHEDYHKLLFVNTVLGGYFGSRLISNIREEKGLTYGIYSMIDTHLTDGSLMISSEVANENVFLTTNEIYKEMDHLCQHKITQKELDLVKNYICGMYVNFFDGPLNSIRAIKSLVLNGIPLSELNTLIDISRSVSSEDILNTSQQYLNRNDFWIVTVGAS